ncbi:MAG: sugar transferase [Rhodopseudomonas palustris]|nr:sugar transferase [Rhodopseudomonas palustris]
MLRKLGIDEIPQLINVLRGEMSLVGPRPHALAHDTEYDRLIASYAQRHKMKPGITGWAQINGFTRRDARARHDAAPGGERPVVHRDPGRCGSISGFCSRP